MNTDLLKKKIEELQQELDENKNTLMTWKRSLEDAQAKVELLLQMGAFCKDFNVNNLAGSFI